MSRLAPLFVLLAACGPKSPPVIGGDPEVVTATPDAATPQPEPPKELSFAMASVAEETAYTTPWGATITIAPGWYVGAAGDLVRVQDPEQELTLTLLVEATVDRDAAFAAAWQRVDPRADLEVAEVYDVPGMDGWEASAQAIYVTPSQDQRAVVAFGRRHQGQWHVALIEGGLAAIDRRGAQLNAVVLDMKVPGIEEESWADRTPRLGASQLEQIDAFVEAARVQAGIPGAAIAIVHGGKIVLANGYGKRGLGKKAKPVKPGTAFMIGSTTKSLTTLMMARLVDAGTVAWDSKITELLPSFALGDADVTAALTLQHTVCACTGMPRQDLEFLFEYGGWTPERRLAAMATMAPTTGFGETFQYSNSLVAAGGYAAAHQRAPKKKLGPAYDAAMQALVFDALGMKGSTLDFATAQKGDWAKPTAQDLELTYREFPIAYEQAVSALRPAGGVWSTAHDMAAYLILELANGKTAKGKQLVTEASLLHRRDPQVKIADGFSYGIGLFVSDEHGLPVVHHGGNMLGYTSDMVFFPGADFGYVLLANAGSANAFRDAIRGRVLEIVYEAKPQATDAFTAELAISAQAAAERRALLVAAPDEAWQRSVLDTWGNDALGKITLRKDGKKLVLDAGEWQTEFTQIVDRDGGDKVITIGPPYAGFQLRPAGNLERPLLVLDAGQQVYEFVRRGSAP